MDAIDDRTFSGIVEDELSAVFFMSPGCPGCAAQKPAVLGLARELGDAVRFYAADVARTPIASEAYRITIIPTLILFLDGREAWRHEGLLGPRDLRKAARDYLGV